MPFDPDRKWTAEDVPPGPYYHGSRRVYEEGELLLTDVVCNIEGEEDDRQMCYATTSIDNALDWAYRRGLRHGGDVLYVYEVDMAEPEVDVNMHRPGVDEPITSVMSPQGRVVRVAHQVRVSEYPHAIFGETRPVSDARSSFCVHLPSGDRASRPSRAAISLSRRSAACW